MPKSTTQHRCEECGYIETKWFGKCPACGEWNTAIEEPVPSKQETGGIGRNGLINSKKPSKMKDIAVDKKNRLVTQIDEFDRVMGGGIVRDSVTVLSSPPGMGKSTLLGILANQIGLLGYTVLYISGEESDSQIKSRADRTCNNISDNLWVVTETCMEKIEEYIKEINPTVIICDSLQTMYLASIPTSRPGSPTQTNEVAYKLIQIAKNPLNPRIVLSTSQMTKDDELRGDRTLEHAVDVVLYLEGDRTGQLRILRSNGKNRYGNSSESGLFLLNEEGMVELKNPSDFFTTTREAPVSGSALSITREGSRNFVTEIESLVSKSYFGFPSRKAVGVKKDILEILVEILEQRAGLNFYDKNVTVMSTGGLRLTETAVNLGICMSIASSYYKQALPERTVFIGEVGLTGEIKTVPNVESRVKELARMGFAKVFIPKGNLKNTINGIEVVEVKTVREIIGIIFDEEVRKLEKAINDKDQPTKEDGVG